MIRLYPLALILLTLTACYSPGDKLHDELGGHSETGRPALHAIQDKQLHELMDRMDALMQERFMAEPELDAERRKYAQRIAVNARSLSQTVDNIIDRMPSLQLTGDEQHTFLALARKLREQSRQLQEQAQANQIDAVTGTMHQINTTCTSCHALFRKMGD
jgi:cytochrome c556